MSVKKLGDVIMDDIAYYTVDEWLRWINKTARPKMAAFLKEHIDGKILKTVPRKKDNGEAITLTFAAKNRWHDIDGVYFVFSQVINVQDGRREIFGDGYASLENLMELQGKKLNEGKHNARGAGRKPASNEVQNKIRDCISAGMSVRATANECGVSVATVQKYK